MNATTTTTTTNLKKKRKETKMKIFSSLIKTFKLMYSRFYT